MSKESKRREALVYHAKPKPGKIEVVPTKKYATQRDLSLAYSPGVAIPCLEIEKNKENAYKYTAKGNLVAVISNGTAVLGRCLETCVGVQSHSCDPLLLLCQG